MLKQPASRFTDHSVNMKELFQLWWLGGLLVPINSVQGLASTCSLIQGPESLLICKFSEVVNNTDIIVKQYLENGSEDEVLQYLWPKTMSTAECIAQANYSLHIPVTDILLVKIPNHSKETYRCQGITNTRVNAFQDCTDINKAKGGDVAQSSSENPPALEELESSCQVFTGAEAYLLCTFSEGQKYPVAVYFTPDGSSNPESVAVCTWEEGEPVCRTQKDYTFYGWNSGELLIKISRSRDGQFLCQGLISRIKKKMFTPCMSRHTGEPPVCSTRDSEGKSTTDLDLSPPTRSTPFTTVSDSEDIVTDTPTRSDVDISPPTRSTPSNVSDSEGTVNINDVLLTTLIVVGTVVVVIAAIGIALWKRDRLKQRCTAAFQSIFRSPELGTADEKQKIRV